MSQKNSPAKKKRGPKPKLDPELVAAALAMERGNLAAVARKFHVDRHTVRDLVDSKPNLKQILVDAREGFLDTAEASLYKAVEKREAWAVCFVLKTLGKGRGYVERQQVESIDGTKLEIVEEIVVARTKTQETDPPSVDPAVADAN